MAYNTDSAYFGIFCAPHTPKAQICHTRRITTCIIFLVYNTLSRYISTQTSQTEVLQYNYHIVVQHFCHIFTTFLQQLEWGKSREGFSGNSVALHLAVEGTAVEIEKFGGLRFVAADLQHGLTDQFFLAEETDHGSDGRLDLFLRLAVFL